MNKHIVIEAPVCMAIFKIKRPSADCEIFLNSRYGFSLLQMQQLRTEVNEDVQGCLLIKEANWNLSTFRRKTTPMARSFRDISSTTWLISEETQGKYVFPSRVSLLSIH